MKSATTVGRTDDTPDTAARLSLTMTRLARQLRQETNTGLSPSQASALSTVARRGPLTLGAVAEVERVAPPTITKVIAKLEASELIRREPDASDGRVTLVEATAAGRALLAESRQHQQAWLTARLNELDDDQRARLASALDVLELITGAPTGAPASKGTDRVAAMTTADHESTP